MKFVNEFVIVLMTLYWCKIVIIQFIYVLPILNNNCIYTHNINYPY